MDAGGASHGAAIERYFKIGVPAKAGTPILMSACAVSGFPALLLSEPAVSGLVPVRA